MKYQDHQNCIEACLECASTCKECIVSCLKEDESEIAKLTMCMQLNLECSTACLSAAEMMTLGSKLSEDYCVLCAEMCERCARECDSHPIDHCREAARACRKCAKACRELITHILAVY